MMDEWVIRKKAKGKRQKEKGKRKKAKDKSERCGCRGELYSAEKRHARVCPPVR